MNSLGRQLVVEYYDCDPSILNDVSLIESSMVDAAKAADATVINSTFHHFSPWGVSGVVVIQESHLAIHTWPEFGYVALDIFTCGDTVDPWICYKFLEKAFKADYASAMEMLRGQESQLGRPNAKNTFVNEDGVSKPAIRHNRNIWFTERNEDIAMSLRHKGDRLYVGQSDFQKVEVYDTYAYGRLLQSYDGDKAHTHFLLADRYYKQFPFSGPHNGFVATQLAAYAISAGRGSEALSKKVAGGPCSTMTPRSVK